MSRAALDWARDGAGWPNADASRFVKAAGIQWHVQEAGPGASAGETPDAPTLLLLHGTGAATHSWRGLLPLLARRFRVIAPDLPGHGFTERPVSYRLSLPGMAAALDDLLSALNAAPAMIIGHSAGAAIALRMALDHRITPRAILGLNAALLPFPGLAGIMFPQIARMLFLNPFAPQMFAWTAADRGRVEGLISGTGSQIDAEGMALYARLFRAPGHCAGALGMMAHWDLRGLMNDLPGDLDARGVRVSLAVGALDRTVPPSAATVVRETLTSAEIRTLEGVGHLAHEEQPETVATLIEEICDAAWERARPPQAAAADAEA